MKEITIQYPSLADELTADVMVVRGKQKAQYFEKLLEYTSGK